MAGAQRGTLIRWLAVVSFVNCRHLVDGFETWVVAGTSPITVVSAVCCSLRVALLKYADKLEKNMF